MREDDYPEKIPKRMQMGREELEDETDERDMRDKLRRNWQDKGKAAKMEGKKCFNCNEAGHLSYSAPTLLFAMRVENQGIRLQTAWRN